MTDLIVDFPQRCISPLNAKSKRKTVQFTDGIDLSFFESYGDAFASDIWYGPQEYREMRTMNKKAVLDVHTKLRNSNTQDLDEFILTGIEHILTPRLIRKSQRRKARHRQSVLEEQARQDYVGVNDPFELAKVSKHHSDRAVKQAYSIALFRVDATA